MTLSNYQAYIGAIPDIRYEYICPDKDCGTIWYLTGKQLNNSVQDCICGKMFLRNDNFFKMIDVSNPKHPYWDE